MIRRSFARLVAGAALALPGLAAGEPSLSTTSLSGPASATAGQPYAVSYTITNQGDVASPSSHVRFFFSSTPSPTLQSLTANYATATSPRPSNYPVFLVEKAVSPLQPGQASADSITVGNLPTWIAGSYWLVAMTDLSYQGQEQYSQVTMGTSVAVAGPFIPDLIVRGLSGSSATGGLFVIICTVGDAATAGGPAPAFDVGFYLSRDTTLSPDDVFLGSLYPPALVPGQFYTNSLPVTLPSGLNGAYWLIAKANRSNAFYESNTSNNVYVAPNQVTITEPDLVVSSCSGQPPRPRATRTPSAMRSRTRPLTRSHRVSISPSTFRRIRA